MKDHPPITPQALFNQLPNIVFWKDNNLRYIGCNDDFAKIAGLTSHKEIIGKTDFDLPWCDTEAEKYRSDDKSVLKTSTNHFIREPLLIAKHQKGTSIGCKKVLYNDSDIKIGIVGSFIVNFPKLDVIKSLLNYVYQGYSSIIINRKKKYVIVSHHKYISLSARQVEVVLCWLAGLTMKEIGERLFISVRTAETHMHNVRQHFRHQRKSYILQELIKS